MTQVLIVDDNEQNLYMLQVLLEGHGFQVVSAGNGAEALEIARRTPPDMIITDILMPVMDGFTLCREWKNDSRLKNIPFVFYTATYTDPKDEEFALSLGAERFIIKPAEPDVLVDILKNVIAEYEAGRLVAAQDPVDDDAVYLKDYNETLIRKLEAKVSELEATNRAFEQEIAERKRAENAERDQRQLAEALRDIASVLSGTLQLHEVMDRILEHVGRVVPHDAANIALITDGDAFRIIAGRGYEAQGVDPNAILQLRFSVEGTPNLAEMRRTGEPFLVTNTAQFEGWTTLPETRWVQAYLGAPIVLDGETLGFISLDSATPGFFTQEHAERLRMFANHAAIAIRNAQLYQELEDYRQYLEQTVAKRTAALRASETRYRGIVEDQTELICRFTTDGTLTFVNAAYCRYFDRSPEELVGLSFMPHIPGEDQPVLSQQLTALSPEHPLVTVERHVIKPDGEIRWLEWTHRMLSGTQGSPIEIQAVGRDITERKQAEQLLRQALAREMELSEMRSRFLSMASHDLRTPLAVIQTNTDMLSQYAGELSEDQRQVKFDQIRTSIQVMIHMLNDVLTVGKIEAGRLAFEPAAFDLRTFCQVLVDDARMIADQGQEITFICADACATVVMDKKLVRHIVSNLLSNAIKYSPDNSPITFDLACDGQQAMFRIHDQGIGIPKPDQQRLFETFHRAANVGHISGTGLGLAIVKQSVDLHGGTIEFESVEGMGTTFIVTIPYGLPKEKSQ